MKKNKNEKKNLKPYSSKKPSIPVTFGGLNVKWIYMILIAFTFILYGNTLGHDYAIDDAIVITDNMYTQKGFSGMWDIFSHDTFLGFFKQEKSLVAGGRYRPLSLLTFAFEHSLFGESPFPRHLINILLYALTGIAIFLFLKRLLLQQQTKYSNLVHLPFIAALIFIALPIHTEAVANIKGRDEILSLLFSITAANLFLKYLDEGKKNLNLILGFVSLLLGLLSKENAITFFLIIPMMIWFFRKAKIKDYFLALLPVVAPMLVGMVFQGSSRDIIAIIITILAILLVRKIYSKDYIIVMIPVIIATGIFLLLRQSFTNTSIGKEVTELMNNPFFGMTAAQKYATIIFTFGKYLSVMILPITLSHDYYPYQIAIHDFSNIGTIICLFITIGGLVIALIQLGRKTLLSFCILFFVLTFSVVSNLVFPVGTFMSERFLFIPSLAFCIMLAYLITLIPFYRFNTFPFSKIDISAKSVTDSFFRTRTIQFILLIIVGGYSVRTIFRNPAWKDNFTLFSTDISNSPNSAKLNNAMGGELIAQSDKDVSETAKMEKINRAKIYLQKAIQIYPLYNNAYLLLGNAYLKGDKNYEQAFEEYKGALRINPDYGDAIRNISVLMNAWDDYPKKITALNNFIQEQPTNSRMYYQLGLVYYNANQFDEAVTAYKKAIALNDNFSDAYNQLGMVYGRGKSMFDSSIHYLNLAVLNDPNNVEAYENLGVGYAMKKDFSNAKDAFTKGLLVNPNNAKLYLNLGITYMQLGEQQQGQQYMNKAFELDPSLKPGNK